MRGLSGFAIALGVLLGGCSEIERAKLYNATSAPIVVRLTADVSRGPDRGDVLVTLKPGQSRTFVGAELRRDRLPVTAGGCVRTYALDGVELWKLREAGLAFPIELEIRPDATLDLRRSTVERRDFRRAREFGFPRRVISEACG